MAQKIVQPKVLVSQNPDVYDNLIFKNSIISSKVEILTSAPTEDNPDANTIQIYVVPSGQSPVYKNGVLYLELI